MAVNKVIGIILIVVGLIALTLGGFSYMKRDKVFDAGKVEITREKRETIPISPLVGLLALGGGVVLLATANRRRLA